MKINTIRHKTPLLTSLGKEMPAPLSELQLPVFEKPKPRARKLTGRRDRMGFKPLRGNDLASIATAFDELFNKP
jgi:hypothetical protein